MKKLLYEISIIRPLIIFLLVVYHSLCVFTGGWPAPAGVPDNACYWWLGHLISGFRIETIAFVGGYVFCYQSVELGRRSRFFPFAWKKFKRLIIPCFVFGIAFFLLFRFNPAHFSWKVAFWRVANGIEHLWFLPMLFWCFLAAWLVDWVLNKVNQLAPRWYLIVGFGVLIALAIVSLFRITGLRMGLSRAPYFLFYFYLGYWLRALRAELSTRAGSVGLLPIRHEVTLGIVLWVIYLVFLLLHLQSTHLQLPGCDFSCPSWLRGASQLQLRLYSLGHTTCGILALYFTVDAALDSRKNRLGTEDIQPSKWLRECSRLCYGVYVLHMFFIKYLYYFSPMPQWMCGSTIGMWLMPWVVLAIILALSVIATHLLLKTRVGRFLIG